MNFDAGTWWLITIAATAAIGAITYFLRQTIGDVNEHDDAIHNIQRTYVTQEDFKAYKNESRDDIQQLTKDINDLKERCLTKEDYYRSQAAVNTRLDKIYDLLYEAQKGANHGGE